MCNALGIGKTPGEYAGQTHNADFLLRVQNEMLGDERRASVNDYKVAVASTDWAAATVLVSYWSEEGIETTYFEDDRLHEPLVALHPARLGQDWW